MTRFLLVSLVSFTTACGATSAPVSHDGDARIVSDTTALSYRSLSGSSLPALQLLASDAGRDLFAHVVACALPAGATLTAIDRAGAPHSFSGSAGLAPSWAARPATVAQREEVTTCVLLATSGAARA